MTTPQEQYGSPINLKNKRPGEDRLPSEPADYLHILRGPRNRWWRPIVSFFLLLVGLCISFAATPLFALGALTLSGSNDVWKDLEDPSNSIALLTGNLLLASFIALSGLSTWIVFRIRPGYLSSVAGHIRWRWLGICFIAITPIWSVYLAIQIFREATFGNNDFSLSRDLPSDWIIFLVIIILTIPFQAAGEEYLFRGWITQHIGSLIKYRWLAIVLVSLVSSIFFSAAHGSFDLWVFLSLTTFSLFAIFLTLKTGGLEAAIALHVINNLIALSVTLYVGDIAQAFITADTKGNPIYNVIEIVFFTIVTFVVLKLAKRHKVETHYRPTSLTQPTTEAQ